MVVTSLIAGCGVKIVYNNMDRIAVWVADDYFDLTRDQKRFLAAQMDSFGYRHRRDELPQYAAGIRAFEAASADGLSYHELAGFEAQVEQWGRHIMIEVLGILGELLLSASAEQWDHVAAEIQRSNEEILRRARDHDQAELRALWGDDYIDTIERFIGRTTPRQRDYIESLA
ncbi:MAG: DUF6279 family lipoprotein, partial [Gammaproteobacteria bacterium]|nr:DUF6279 family lipoprotein [Gammaproteobacteria bacterium]